MEHHKSDDKINCTEITTNETKTTSICRKISLPGPLENIKENPRSPMFYVGDETENKPQCSPLAKMTHLLPPEATSSTEELPSPRSRTGSILSTGTTGTEEDTDCDCEHHETSVRRRSSTWDNFKMRRASVKKRKNRMSESDVSQMVQDASPTMHKSKSESASNWKKIQRGMKKLTSLGGRRSSTGTNLHSKSIEDNLTEIVGDYPSTFIGFFLLFVNFTADLTGYSKDRNDLRNFFETNLGYEFREYVDCTANEIFDAIDRTKQEIQNMASQGKEKFQLIVSILSHGEVEGIHTCQDKRGFLKETSDESKEYKVTSLEDIIAKFKHDDGFHALKGMPKMFFIQACHGEEILRAAGGSSSNHLKATAAIGKEETLDYHPAVPVDADLLVLFAATKYNKAFVPSVSGSWLIQTMLDVFKNLSKETDIEVMLKAVTRAVSHKRGCILEGDKPELAVQVPFRQSSLRANCYLQSK